MQQDEELDHDEAFVVVLLGVFVYEFVYFLDLVAFLVALGNDRPGVLQHGCLFAILNEPCDPPFSLGRDLVVYPFDLVEKPSLCHRHILGKVRIGDMPHLPQGGMELILVCQLDLQPFHTLDLFQFSLGLFCRHALKWVGLEAFLNEGQHLSGVAVLVWQEELFVDGREAGLEGGFLET